MRLLLLGDAGSGGASGDGLAILLSGAAFLFVLLIFAIIFFSFFLIWLRAAAAGAKVTFIELIAMRLRKVPVGLIVDARINAIKSGIQISVADLSMQRLAGGNPVMVVQALIAARGAGIPLAFENACAIDLASRATDKSILEAVKSAVTPWDVQCPDPAGGQDTVAASTGDESSFRAKGLLTLRTNLDRFIGGASQTTLVGRVAEAMAAAIRTFRTSEDLLQRSGQIAGAVLRLGLDSNTAFEILSLKIDIERVS